MQVLGIDVDHSLAVQWRTWLAPDTQPFFLSVDQIAASGLDALVPRTRVMSDELRDTYAAYRVPRHLDAVWMDEQAFRALPRSVRAPLVRAQVEHRRALVPSVRGWSDSDAFRAQADGHRFVWWPSMLGDADDALVALIVERREGLMPSRHLEVRPEVWRTAAPILPCAEELAGTFPPGSGPNCFGTVMAAEGVPGAATAWMMQDLFEAWLKDRTRPMPRGMRAAEADARPGTVLVWRDSDNAAQHAAVTLGGGWALHKPSQSWATPRKVLAVRDIVRSCREEGLRLHRYPTD